MRHALRNFHAALSRDLAPRTRLAVALLVLPLLLSFVLPLWRISLDAPQYPQGLTVDIFPHELVGGHDGADINEINILNHYIGMRHITRSELRDLDWLPFAIGGLALLALRVAAVGNVRSLVDIAVLTSYFCAFAMGRFVYTLYRYGHELSPDAPFKVPGFTPGLFGTKQVANFTTHSFPQGGAVGLLVFAGGLAVLALVALRSRAAGPEAGAQPGAPRQVEASLASA
jgi:hypothetical protein